jgi:endonuclease-3
MDLTRPPYQNRLVLPRPTKRLATKPRPTRQRARRILDRLERAHPEAKCALDHRSAFELAVATILSAQCTDERVNQVTPRLFERYPDARALAAAPPADVEEIIRSTGFFRAKTRSITGFAGALVERHGGEVPRTMEALVPLPGIGRKTANVVLGHAFGVNEGIAVDTHVLRVTNRLGLAESDDPAKVEQQLMALVPRERWTRTTDLLIFHGRKVCDARRPACGVCPLFAECAWESRQAWAAGVPPPRPRAKGTRRTPAVPRRRPGARARSRHRPLPRPRRRPAR